jgi:hypothetical protein
MDGKAEAIRALQVVPRSTLKTRTQAANGQVEPLDDPEAPYTLEPLHVYTSEDMVPAFGMSTVDETFRMILQSARPKEAW